MISIPVWLFIIMVIALTIVGCIIGYTLIMIFVLAFEKKPVENVTECPDEIEIEEK